MLKRIIYILFVLVSLDALATHNRAGEITFSHISGLTYEITVTTYTKDSSPADRPKLEIRWGDNSPLDSIPRITEVLLGNDIKMNVYKEQHTYPGGNPSPYIISVEDPNRNSGIQNIPNSVNVVFYLQTELYINPFMGVNNSPILLNPPIDNACVGFIYVHNPGAVDLDGDSLYYTLEESLKEGGQPILNYQFPQASNFITIDNFTGDLVWDSPLFIGEFNVAILITEFRNGVKIGSILRDMQITVVAGCDPPPNISGPTDTCVVAGDTLDLNYSATSSNHAVTLTSTGIPYSLTFPAFFQQTTLPAQITSANFYWESKCNHVRNSPYFVSIKAVDDGPYNLADFHTTTILVIGPKPENLIATVQTNNINLIWDKTRCSQVIGYKIYRRLGPSGWSPGPCETGIPPPVGFQLIATTSSINDTTFSDNNNGIGLIPGEDYCYRIVACYPDGSQSIASDEVCNQLIKDVPIITRVNVNTTSQTTGSIYVEWSKPTEHDTIQYPGPYRYLIYRGEQSSSSLILIDSTLTINDTSYTDTLLNTSDFQYFYRVDIYNVPNIAIRDLMGKSTVASSVYLNLIPSDNQMTLVWNEAVPWTNSQHVIYRQNPITFIFDSLDITSNSNYVDTGLANLTTYCYKVKSIGGYTSPNVINPILNFSQEICDQPIDNVIPCPPTICVEVDCKQQQNRLHWINQNPGCAEDVLQFNIYKKDSLNGEYVLIANIPNGTDSSYLHANVFSIVGCYVITGIDSVGNESLYSDSVCVDNPNGACAGNNGCVYNVDETAATECFVYRLPNIFTPGRDGYNDVFMPFPYKFVESVNMEIFNRWGNLVYQTTNPDILWDGTNQNNNKQCGDGTYFYVCTVNEICLKGIEPRVLKGFITLIRNKGATKP